MCSRLWAVETGKRPTCRRGLRRTRLRLAALRLCGCRTSGNITAREDNFAAPRLKPHSRLPMVFSWLLFEKSVSHYTRALIQSCSRSASDCEHRSQRSHPEHCPMLSNMTQSLRHDALTEAAKCSYGRYDQVYIHTVQRYIDCRVGQDPNLIRPYATCQGACESFQGTATVLSVSSSRPVAAPLPLPLWTEGVWKPDAVVTWEWFQCKGPTVLMHS